MSSYTTKDEGEGYVYLVEAKGFHGVLSFAIKRRKIGLSNCPERRLKELNSEQAPCPIVGIRYIQVRDNVAVEKQLHQRFAKNRKHGEWFDFWVWELPFVDLAYDRRAEGTLANRITKITKRDIAAIALSITGIAAIAFSTAIAVQSFADPDFVQYRTKTDSLDRNTIKEKH